MITPISKYDCAPVRDILAGQLPGGHLVIPDGTTAIGSGAFEKCENIKQITVPDSVVLIGRNAFAGTPWFDKQPDGMVYVGKVAYKWKGDMPEDTHVTLRDDTIGIAGAAFSEQKNLAGVTIPEGVKAIGYMAFYCCTNLTDINIPDSIEYIESSAFEDTAWYDSQPDGMVYAGKVAYSFKGTMPRRHHEIIRDGTVSITADAFGNADKYRRLTAVTIPESVTIISDSIFCDFLYDFGRYVTIYCKEGSCAHEFARRNSFKFKFTVSRF